VSVVIPCRNAAYWIADQLAALERQSCGRSWEIILVDNGSTDGSVHEAKEFALRLPQMLIVTANERRGAGYARNAGVRASRGELLLFCDADDAVGAGWLAAMVRALEDHPFVAARLDHLSLNAPWLHRSRHNVQSTGLIPDVFLPVASGGSLGIRRRLFLAVGGFDETLATNEDHEFCWRVQLRSAPLHFVPEAVVNYRHRCTLSETFVQAVRYGRDKLVLLRSYRQAGHDIPMHRWRGYAHEFMRVALEAPLHVWRADSLALWVSDFGYRLGLLLGWLDKPQVAPARSTAIPAVAGAALRAERSKMRAAPNRNHAFFET
jgi:GT2 family glycosyltransferase